MKSEANICCREPITEFRSVLAILIGFTVLSGTKEKENSVDQRHVRVFYVLLQQNSSVF